MEKKKIQLAFLAFLSALIIGVPVSMVIQHEAVLKHGKEFRFRTAPVDPFDAFRGRYVALSIENNSVPAQKVNYRYGQEVYASVENDPDGFAKFSAVSASAPASGDYIKCRVRHSNPGGGTVSLDVPIDRYYMEEGNAPKAERLYMRLNRQGKQRDAYVVVAVDRGNVLVKKLYVGGKPVEDAVREEGK